VRHIRLLTTFGLALALQLSAAGSAQAGTSTSHHASKASKKRTARKRSHPIFSGHLVRDAELRTEPLPRPSGKLKLYSVNLHERLEIELYDGQGMLREDSLDTLNHFWRCRRTGTEKPINPHLFELLSIIQDHFDGRTIELVSGFRNQERTTSYHFHGSASDIRIAGVSDRELHKFVSTLDTGNMGLGLYPRAGFIHVDVRPDSYRWVDWSPPGSEMGHPKKARKRPRPRTS
jgi:uncharacterized protein YcbK (DUF882 family)